MQAADQAPLSAADVPQLLALLQSALSHDASVQKQTEALLASLEQRQGYCSCLAVRVEASSIESDALRLAGHAMARCSPAFAPPTTRPQQSNRRR